MAECSIPSSDGATHLPCSPPPPRLSRLTSRRTGPRSTLPHARTRCGSSPRGAGGPRSSSPSCGLGMSPGVVSVRWFKMKASYMSLVRRPRAQLRQRRLRSRHESRYWSVKTCVVRISRLHRLRPLLRQQNFLVPSRTKAKATAKKAKAMKKS
uniref:Uncharacterized protein n=1 Tax=Zea mays TaxID=4577 RepID=B6T747_MAIZE|nr:hypothetical protein [Zea mays]